MADWSLLRSALGRVDAAVRYTWDELDALVGGLPDSAKNHRAWWSGDRPHVNAWKLAGFSVTDLKLGQEVTFVRGAAVVPEATPPARPETPTATGADLLLMACVKKKGDRPAPARDLYQPALFEKEKAYADASGLPWYILSAEHGLVAPDEWLSPYERYLPDTPPSFRAAWGDWVVERLELLGGSLYGRVIEVHAGGAHVEAMRTQLAAKGAVLLEPLSGLSMGERLSWYGKQSPAPMDSTAHADAAAFVEALLDVPAAQTPAEFAAAGPSALSRPGLYSWWVDASGAEDLTRGLGQKVASGLIYAGLAGATRWPSGRRSTNTLWSRIAGMHLGKKHEFSTFRRTLGSILASASGAPDIDEHQLTAWMHEHLRVIAIPYDDADTLGKLEETVLEQLDPPLNLKGMNNTKIRSRVSELRRPFARKRREK